jgi:uncharacterized NAD(P)/FAD-binding protein YdhS
MTLNSDAGHGSFDVAIVGGGFSGVMVALNAARAAPARTRIAIVERREEHGRGTAYAGRPRDAILNVPAGAMGAFPDRPGDFVRWLGGVDPSAYLPRHRYGEYVRALLAQAQADGHAIVCLRADVADVRRAPAGRVLVDDRAASIATGAHVVLALGAPPPADLVSALPAEVRNHPAYVPDPWTFLREPAFAATGEILVAGSGLTALDVIGAFARSGARNRLQVVSRGGRFPLAHAAAGAGPPIGPIPAGRRPDSIAEIVALVRSAVREAAASNSDWRRVMDGLRPAIPDLWSGLGLAERRRFLRHVRPLFDPHRHRAPAALLAQKDALAARDQLTVSAARIVDFQPRGKALEVTLQPRGEDARRATRVTQLINCSGPANDYASSAEPLVRNLLARGEICADPSGLGLRTLPDGRLVEANGTPSADLFTIGWPMRGTLLETTAVRELREHAVRLGALLAACAHTRSSRSR